MEAFFPSVPNERGAKSAPGETGLNPRKPKPSRGQAHLFLRLFAEKGQRVDSWREEETSYGNEKSDCDMLQQIRQGAVRTSRRILRFW